MPSIISSLSNSRKKLTKKIITSLLTTSLLCGVGFTTYFKEKSNYSKRQGDVLKILVEKNQESAIDYLKDNPQLVEGIENSHKMLSWLEQIITKPEKKAKKTLEKKFSVENKNRVVLDKNIYFSGSSLNEDSFFVKNLDMVFDPQGKSLYKLDGSMLTKAINNVENVISFPDKTYFSQGDSVFKRENKGDEKFSRVYQGKSNTLLRKINGTDLLLIFSGDKFFVLGEKGKDKKRIEMYMKNFSSNREFYTDETTKVMFKRDHLYLNNKNHLYSMRSDATHVEAPFFEDFVDYMVDDLDNDGKDEVALSITNGNVKVYSGEKEKYNITGKSIIRFDKEMQYRWLNPSKLKKDVTAFLRNLK